MKRISIAGALAVLAVAGAFAGAARPAVNPTASWSVVDHCKTGWCKGNDYTGVWTIVKAAGSNRLSGHDNAGNKLTGTIAGAKATFSLKGASYSFVVHATFAASNKTFTGTWTDSRHASGTTKATRQAAGGTKTVTLP